MTFVDILWTIFVVLFALFGQCQSLIKYVPEVTSWDQANSNCKTLGFEYDEAMIKTEALMLEVDKYISRTKNIPDYLWIGLYWKVTEQAFFWIDNEKHELNVDYENWGTSTTPVPEPNNMQPSGDIPDDTYENCVCLYQGKWVTQRCSNTYAALCMEEQFITLTPGTVLADQTITPFALNASQSDSLITSTSSLPEQDVTSPGSSVLSTTMDNDNTSLESLSKSTAADQTTSPSPSQNDSIITSTTESDSIITSTTESDSIITFTTETDSIITSTTESDSIITSTTQSDSIITSTTESGSIVTSTTDSGSIVTSTTESDSIITPTTASLNHDTTLVTSPGSSTVSTTMYTENTSLESFSTQSSTDSNATVPAGSRAIVYCPHDALTLCDCEVVKNVSQGNNLSTSEYVYKVDNKKTSAYLSKYYSANDERLSAKTIGFSGLAVLVSVVLLIVCSDMIRSKPNLTKSNRKYN